MTRFSCDLNGANEFSDPPRLISLRRGKLRCHRVKTSSWKSDGLGSSGCCHGPTRSWGRMPSYSNRRSSRNSTLAGCSGERAVKMPANTTVQTKLVNETVAKTTLCLAGFIRRHIGPFESFCQAGLCSQPVRGQRKITKRSHPDVGGTSYTSPHLFERRGERFFQGAKPRRFSRFSRGNDQGLAELIPPKLRNEPIAASHPSEIRNLDPQITTTFSAQAFHLL